MSRIKRKSIKSTWHQTIDNKEQKFYFSKKSAKKFCITFYYSILMLLSLTFLKIYCLWLFSFPSSCSAFCSFQRNIATVTYWKQWKGTKRDLQSLFLYECWIYSSNKNIHQLPFIHCVLTFSLLHLSKSLCVFLAGFIKVQVNIVFGISK